MTYIKGENNIVADALSRVRLTEKDFSPKAIAGQMAAHEFPSDYPLSYKQIAAEQEKDKRLQERLLDSREGASYVRKTHTFSDKSHDLITRDDKIVLPAKLQRQAVEWYHVHLLHPGSKRPELTSDVTPTLHVHWVEDSS